MSSILQMCDRNLPFWLKLLLDIALMSRMQLTYEMYFKTMRMPKYFTDKMPICVQG